MYTFYGIVYQTFIQRIAVPVLLRKISLAAINLSKCHSGKLCWNSINKFHAYCLAFRQESLCQHVQETFYYSVIIVVYVQRLSINNKIEQTRS